MHFEKNHISFDTAGFSKMFRAYIANDISLQELYHYPPSASSFSLLIEEAKQRNIQRDVLVSVLKDQYNSPLLSVAANYNKVVNSIESLSKQNTFTVCTGHQLCLFTGPLYFIYKIVSAIRLSIELKDKYSQYNFVPVYWMATEDHDFEEINHINVFGKRIEWSKEANVEASNPPVGKIKTPGLLNVLEQVNEILGDSENAAHLKELFEKTYAKHKNLSDATRYLVHELFSEYGLVIIDANDKRLKKAFSSVIKEELLQPKSFTLVNETNNYIQAKGFEPQIKPREINLFYLTENSRERIVFEDEKFKVLNTSISFSKEEIVKELETNPEAFSPNVILRPLYQQAILPNVAYVGGPAEICYWLQLKTVFDHYDIQFPILIPRNSLLLIDEKSTQVLSKFSFSADEIFMPVEKLVKKAITMSSSSEVLLQDIEGQLKNIYLQVAERAGKIDKTLQPMVDAELHKSLKILQGIESKMLRAEKLKQETTVTLVTKLKDKLFPGGDGQERHDNFIPYYLKYGTSFIKLLIEHFDPFDFQFILLKEFKDN
jgi:bacillithiol biosynthesis cysteine-adding enzyme BshC